jgi:RNA polymerase sigma-70 factor (family 1)
MQEIDSYEERLLLHQIAAGDGKAFAIIIGRYWNNIYSQALTYIKSTHSAQDIVQEVFLKVWEKRATLPAIERFDSFLFIITRNHIISGLRKKIALPLNNDLSESFKEESIIPDKIFSRKQLNDLINKAINLLPQQQKTAFLLSRDQGSSYEAIAIEMELSKETVKKHIGKALNFLRTYIRTYAELEFLFIITFNVIFF